MPRGSGRRRCQAIDRVCERASYSHCRCPGFRGQRRPYRHATNGTIEGFVAGQAPNIRVVGPAAIVAVTLVGESRLSRWQEKLPPISLLMNWQKQGADWKLLSSRVNPSYDRVQSTVGARRVEVVSLYDKLVCHVRAAREPDEPSVLAVWALMTSSKLGSIAPPQIRGLRAIEEGDRYRRTDLTICIRDVGSVV